MPVPLTISEAGRKLKRHRATVRRRIDALGLRVNGALSPAQFRALERSFADTPVLPPGVVKCG